MLVKLNSVDRRQTVVQNLRTYIDQLDTFLLHMIKTAYQILSLLNFQDCSLVQTTNSTAFRGA